MIATKRLLVFLGEVQVGSMTFENERAAFRLSRDYLGRTHRPILGQVFEDDLGKEYRVTGSVPNWFRNLLPEGPLRELIAQQIGVHPTRDYFLLGHLGEDLPGAVRALPEDPDAFLDDAQDTFGDEAEPLSSEHEFKFSLAGVQLKFSVLADDRGLTIPVAGEYGDFIAKLPDQRFEGVPENEFSMMTWAREIGITVPDFSLVSVETIAGIPEELVDPGSAAFLVKRFDRDAGSRVHIEDLAQVLDRPPTPKGKYGGANYETVARILLALGGFEDVEEFVRRLLAIIAMGNGDAHLKNWSLIYRDGATARLSPAYDLVATSTYSRVEETLALNFAKTKDFAQIELASFRRLARKLNLSSETIFDDVVEDTIERLRSKWFELRDELPMGLAVREAIDRRLDELPILRV